MVVAQLKEEIEDHIVVVAVKGLFLKGISFQEELLVGNENRE